MRLALKLLLAVLASFLAVEAALHLVPGVLPAWYLGEYPAGGIEFFERGALSEVPIEGLPLPLRNSGWDDKPPADLKEHGIAPLDVDDDERRYPRVRVPCDARGLTNPEALERAEILLVGDSFLVAAGVVEPPGMVARLAQETGKQVYSLGVAGIGPVREAWLLEEIGLALEPKLVIWFFFGGNDVKDTRVIVDRLAMGRTSHADLEAYRPPPRWILPSLIQAFARRREVDSREAKGGPLPGFRFEAAGESAKRVRELWFWPIYLYHLASPMARIAQGRAWEESWACIQRSRALCEERGARFVVVYLPSKEQVYWPYVERDPELLERTLHFDSPEASFDPTKFGEAMLEYAGDLEELVASSCSEAGIPFHSGTPALTALAARGELGYLVTDTHWQIAGQEAVLETLLDFLRETGQLDF